MTSKIKVGTLPEVVASILIILLRQPKTTHTVAISLKNRLIDSSPPMEIYISITRQLKSGEKIISKVVSVLSLKLGGGLESWVRLQSTSRRSRNEPLAHGMAQLQGFVLTDLYSNLPIFQGIFRT